MKSYLAGLPADFLSLRDLAPAKDVEEKGRSFLENARLKSLAWSLKCADFVLAEDSGLEVDHLDGAPGIFSARFSAPQPTDEKNIRKVLELMENVPWSRRKARFISTMVLAHNGKIIKKVEGRVKGYIALEARGARGFGYDPIFYYPPLRKNFGELEPEEKNKVSHRGRALRKMRAFLLVYLRGAKKEDEREGG